MFADFCRFSWELQHFGRAANRRFSQLFLRKLKETADLRGNPFVHFCLSASVTQRGRNKGGVSKCEQTQANADKRGQTQANAEAQTQTNADKRKQTQRRKRRGANASKREQTWTNANKRLHPPLLQGFLHPPFAIPLFVWWVPNPCFANPGAWLKRPFGLAASAECGVAGVCSSLVELPTDSFHFGRGEKTPKTPKISALLRKRPVLLKANFVLTKDRKRPYYGHFLEKARG